jgi:hypothetical protein
LASRRPATGHRLTNFTAYDNRSEFPGDLRRYRLHVDQRREVLWVPTSGGSLLPVNVRSIKGITKSDENQRSGSLRLMFHAPGAAFSQSELFPSFKPEELGGAGRKPLKLGPADRETVCAEARKSPAQRVLSGASALRRFGVQGNRLRTPRPLSPRLTSGSSARKPLRMCHWPDCPSPVRVVDTGRVSRTLRPVHICIRGLTLRGRGEISATCTSNVAWRYWSTLPSGP